MRAERAAFVLMLSLVIASAVFAFTLDALSGMPTPPRPFVAWRWSLTTSTIVVSISLVAALLFSLSSVGKNDSVEKTLKRSKRIEQKANRWCEDSGDMTNSLLVTRMKGAFESIKVDAREMSEEMSLEEQRTRRGMLCNWGTLVGLAAGVALTLFISWASGNKLW